MANTTLYLVRHGETFENKNHIFQGILGTKLTPKGIQQANALGNFFKTIPLQAAFTSPLSRARDTMSGVLKHHSNIVPILRENLHEIEGGDIQGLPFSVCNERYDNILDTFRDNPSAFAPPGGESMPEVYARFTKEISSLIQMNAGKTFVVVSHGTAIQTWLSYTKGLPADQIQFDFLPNGSVCCFDCANDKITPKYIGRLPDDH
ncbi:phosphoglycerate mutase family protein [Pseudoramibacter alactolyticus ATCC 23263]|uniref:Phosphoglycerate mutase family protein n=1 Tax=Pseudoramibacter alactolyticus ATCC 23263 TaxID=887929 RepID=E6MJ61_9FIRM|nr:histidine phosphatase family protein [Pseudoramibacter alactolyticus]EFV00881.1 phosphoglycerate mutase family protein [Pseudoramibacter alactolyticus ATCC 23263]